MQLAPAGMDFDYEPFGDEREDGGGGDDGGNADMADADMLAAVIVGNWNPPA